MSDFDDTSHRITSIQEQARYDTETHRRGYPRLIEDGEEDYRLNDGATSAWVVVGNVSVYIVKYDNGVKIETYHNEHEGDDPLGEMFTEFPK